MIRVTLLCTMFCMWSPFLFFKYSEAGLVGGAVVADVFQIRTAYLRTYIRLGTYIPIYGMPLVSDP